MMFHLNGHIIGFHPKTQKLESPLVNPIQSPGGGGRRILSAQTLDAYNFFNKQTKATELGEETIWCSESLSIRFDVTTTTTF